MNMVSYRSRVLLAIFVIMIVVELVGFMPGLDYMAGSFPTYFHKIESVILIFALFFSLLSASFFHGRPRYVALVIIGALMFYSGYKAIMKISAYEPTNVPIIWTSVSFVMSGALAWIIFGAYRLGIFGWRELIISFVTACAGIFYLYSM